MADLRELLDAAAGEPSAPPPVAEIAERARRRTRRMRAATALTAAAAVAAAVLVSIVAQPPEPPVIEEVPSVETSEGASEAVEPERGDLADRIERRLSQSRQATDSGVGGQLPDGAYAALEAAQTLLRAGPDRGVLSAARREQVVSQARGYAERFGSSLLEPEDAALLREAADAVERLPVRGLGDRDGWEPLDVGVADADRVDLLPSGATAWLFAQPRDGAAVVRRLALAPDGSTEVGAWMALPGGGPAAVARGAAEAEGGPGVLVGSVGGPAPQDRRPAIWEVRADGSLSEPVLDAVAPSASLPDATGGDGELAVLVNAGGVVSVLRGRPGSWRAEEIGPGTGFAIAPRPAGGLIVAGTTAVEDPTRPAPAGEAVIWEQTPDGWAATRPGGTATTHVTTLGDGRVAAVAPQRQGGPPSTRLLVQSRPGAAFEPAVLPDGVTFERFEIAVDDGGLVWADRLATGSLVLLDVSGEQVDVAADLPVGEAALLDAAPVGNDMIVVLAEPDGSRTAYRVAASP